LEYEEAKKRDLEQSHSKVVHTQEIHQEEETKVEVDIKDQIIEESK